VELTGQDRHLADTAQATFVERTAELVNAALAPHQVAATAQAMILLHAALEREQTGMPTG
jgi:hypothetical protein